MCAADSAAVAEALVAADASVEFSCAVKPVPEWRPWCCAQDPHGCQSNSQPPCHVSRFGYDYKGDVEDWSTFDAIVTAPHADGTLHNYTRIDWHLPTLFKKGYRHWMECDNMKHCLEKAKGEVVMGVDGSKLTGCTEMLGTGWWSASATSSAGGMRYPGCEASESHKHRCTAECATMPTGRAAKRPNRLRSKNMITFVNQNAW